MENTLCLVGKARIKLQVHQKTVLNASSDALGPACLANAEGKFLGQLQPASHRCNLTSRAPGSVPVSLGPRASPLMPLPVETHSAPMPGQPRSVGQFHGESVWPMGLGANGNMLLSLPSHGSLHMAPWMVLDPAPISSQLWPISQYLLACFAPLIPHSCSPESHPSVTFVHRNLCLRLCFLGNQGETSITTPE